MSLLPTRVDPGALLGPCSMQTPPYTLTVDAQRCLLTKSQTHTQPGTQMHRLTCRRAHSTHILTYTGATLTYTETPASQRSITQMLTHTDGHVHSPGTFPHPPHNMQAHMQTHTGMLLPTQTHTHRKTLSRGPQTGARTHAHAHIHTGTLTPPPSHGHRQTTFTPAQTHAGRPAHTLADAPTRRHALTHAVGALVVSSAAAAVTSRSLGPVWTMLHHFLLQGF